VLPRRAWALVLAASAWQTPPPLLSQPASQPEAGTDAGTLLRLPAREPAAPMGWQSAGWLTRPEREAQELPERMLDGLHLRPGDTVADVGAGVGYHAWRLSARVGPTGTVYATDLQPEMLALLRQTVAERGLRNVVTVQATKEGTGLPDGTMDLILLVDVYHEVQAPLGFLAQLRRALKPKGRLALVEFRAEDPAVPIRAEHKMTAEQVIAELAAGGFRLTERDESLPWQHLLLFVPVR
jgi:SAM-dependent methyltransferase